MASVIIREGLYDKEFVAKWTTGFDEFAAYVREKTPAWAEPITTVRAATIERLAREFATTKPALADVWSGPGQHSNGVQGGRAIAMLNALVGSYDRPGTMLVPDKRGNQHRSVTADDKAAATLAQPRFDELGRYPVGHGSGVYTRSFTNLAEGKGPYQPKMLVCVFQNLMMSVPSSQTVAQALAKLETLVVIDTMLSETAMLADYVLPGTTYLERYDLNSHWVTWPVLGLRQPVVKPLFGQLAEYATVAALARRLGLKEKSGRDHFRVGALTGSPIDDLTAWYEDLLSAELKTGAPGITLAELKALPGAVWVDKGGTRYQKYAEPVSAARLVDAVYDGSPRQTARSSSTSRRGRGTASASSSTARRRRLRDAHTRRLRRAVAHGETDANGKPVSALRRTARATGCRRRSTRSTSSTGRKRATPHPHANNALLLEIKPDNPLIIHPTPRRSTASGMETASSSSRRTAA